MFQTAFSPSRRLNTRIPIRDDTWIYWQCKAHAEASRVLDISLGGVFIQTKTPPAAGSTAEVHFLVQEGQIRAESVVRHAEPGCGMGLRFTAIKDEARPRLISLMSRLRSIAAASRASSQTTPD
jgi:hypothetical protein